MYFVSIIFISILIPSIQSIKPMLNLAFNPDQRYYTNDKELQIICEIVNPTENMESPQLWHVDLQTHKRTPISRSLLNSPTDDSPTVFKQNKNKRLEFLKKNQMRIKNLHLDDSARYECDCPDCEEKLGKQAKDLQVMKLVQPEWHISPGWPLQEDASTTIKCTANDFYPYVGYKIIRDHHEMTNDGKITLPNSNTYPQKFSWETTVQPKADWHNTTLRCTVIQGDSEQHAIKHLDVLFSARFLKCDEKQHIDSIKENASIECSYLGNPLPELTWFRQTDGKLLNSDKGITFETKHEHHGKYKSIVTFNREILIGIPLPSTTTKTPNGQNNSSTQIKVLAENYYEQLLNGGFIAKLTVNKEEKVTRNITIVSDANQARANLLDNSTATKIQNLSTSIILFSFLIILYVIHRH